MQRRACLQKLQSNLQQPTNTSCLRRGAVLQHLIDSDCTFTVLLALEALVKAVPNKGARLLEICQSVVSQDRPPITSCSCNMICTQQMMEQS